MPGTDPQAEQSDRLSRWTRDHGRAVYGFLLGLVRNRHLAEDLLQEVFCRAWQARSRYAETGKERSYLLRIADHLVRDHARRAGREQMVDYEQWQRIEPAGRDGQPHEGLVSAERTRQLGAALDRLTDLQRRTLLLRYYGALEFNEIAEILRCPIGTALSHGRRGLLALRRLLVEKST